MRVLLLGGYGNFGRYISQQLVKVENCQLVVAGRSGEKARHWATQVGAEHAQIDVNENLYEALEQIRPDIVVNTCGPFQNQNYAVAEECIKFGIHYIDLADGRDFVSNIGTLDELAKEKSVLVVSGASSVPCLTSALIDDAQKDIVRIEKVEYGITVAQKKPPGIATTKAILSYVGKAFTSQTNGDPNVVVYGWQNLKIKCIAGLGTRLFSRCDVPDLDLFPRRYPELKNIGFYAGLELPIVHLGLWGLSWFVRLGLIRRLDKYANQLMKLSSWLDFAGSEKSGLFMTVTGKDEQNTVKAKTFELIAREGDGSYIPCIPAILICKKLISRQLELYGALPCIGIVDKHEYLSELRELNISWVEHTEFC